MLKTKQTYGSRSMIYAILFMMMAVMSWSAASAQSPADEATPYPDFQEDVFMDMEFEQNLVTPEVPKNAQKTVSNYIEKIAKGLKHRYTIDVTRNDEVFVIVIPTDDLFLPNDTLFAPGAEKIIDPILSLMKDPWMYKVVVAVHTDDTGSEAYRENLSTARIYTVYDWLMDAMDAGKLSEDVVIIPYARGSLDPLVPNDTRKHRRENRRLEFYFIPGPKMIEKALAKKLK
ncbi:MAG: OmpA family protein [Bacteroides sp.]|nr:OmpA family protein [Bacteroides sp.]